MKLCPDCGHRPSDRYGDGERECGCKCHRIADAAPLLLAACEFIQSHECHHVPCMECYRQAKAAVAAVDR